MASTRESSPALSEAGSASSVQLTPTSKVKALLASLEDDSEDGSVTGVTKENSTSVSKSLTPTKSTNIIDSSKLSAERDVEISKDADTSSEDEEIVRPKGRMAARMQAEQDSSDEDVAVDARERVRRLLAARSKSPTPAANKNNGEDQESDAPVVPRKRKMLQRRRETPKSSPAKGPPSPGLFVSPSKHGSSSPAHDGSDSDDLPENPVEDHRFMALVAKKRQERQALDAEAAKEKAKKAAERRRYTEMMQEDDERSSDGEGGRRLTQQTRPTRKASKKAIEEINRESQRLARNQQLAHQAVTKKKITKESLFAKFNFRGAKKEENVEEPARPTSSSSAAPHSDMETKDTPPTSPTSPGLVDKEIPDTTQAPVTDANDDIDADLPTMEETLASSPPGRVDKGKGKAIEEPIEVVETPKKPMFKQRPIRVRPPKPNDRTISLLDDSDSDLEIVAAKTPKLKKRLDDLFDNVPTKQSRESSGLHALRMLAHLTSPGRQNSGRNKKPSITTTELEMSLHQRARQQAAREREERLDALRAKGVVIQTAEEREREMVDVDDILAAARREQDELAKREKAAAKKARKDNGEVDPLGDSSDDEDWQEPKNVPDEELIVSGSDEDENESGADAGDESGDEEEDEDAMEIDDEEKETSTTNALFDNEASDTDDDQTEAHVSADEEMAEIEDAIEDEEEQLPIQRRARKQNVISDDEDENDEPAEENSPFMTQFDSPLPPKTDSPIAPNSVLRSATKTFIPGLTVAGPAGLGLTQIFAGTMDESQIDSYEPTQSAPRPASPQFEAKQDSMNFLKRFAAPELPPFIPTMSEDTQDVDAISPSQASHIPESQPTQTQAVDLHFSQSQVQEFDTFQETQMSQFDATQDVGFQDRTPIKGRYVDMPPSTVETVILEPNTIPETLEETPIVKKKGKLRKRAPQVAAFSDEEDAGDAVGLGLDEEDFDIDANAFDVMRRASKKKKAVVDDFNKKESKAKEMVHEQADESEDEYAGLGGASDDESGGEEDALVKEMIDDEAGKDADESKIAAFYADRERASDEKQVEKLFKDITSGNLRRKRGADLDLSDSDDGGEAKQRRKRKEFAKMRKALLADERIGKIAENPKRQAFLRAIEDRGSEDEMDFLDDFAEQEETSDSQSQTQNEASQRVVPDSQPTEMGPPKRKRDDASEVEARPPPHLRRTKPAKKPTNLSEIRESLSSLIEEPNSVVAPADYLSDSDDDLEIEDENDLGPGKSREKENRDPFALRRTNVSIIDRISLKRQSSSTVSNSTKLAFTVSSATSGFKVPPLLRRATTNSSITSSTSSSVGGGMSTTERMAGGAGSEGVRRGGGKGSGINYFARESEKRAAVAKREGRREQKLVKGAQVRAKVVGGLFGGGKFE